MRDLGLEIRAGVHTGECERVGDKLGGLGFTSAHGSRQPQVGAKFSPPELCGISSQARA